MTRPGPALLAGGTLALYVTCMSGAMWLAIPNGNIDIATVSFVLAFTAFVSVGALIVARRPDNGLGRIFSAVGLLAATGVLAQEYGEYSYVTQPGPLPGRIVPGTHRGIGSRCWV